MNNITTHLRPHFVSMDEEAHFGTFPCDCCGGRLAGDRFDVEVVGVNKESGKVEAFEAMTVCVDCFVKHAS